MASDAVITLVAAVCLAASVIVFPSRLDHRSARPHFPVTNGTIRAWNDALSPWSAAAECACHSQSELLTFNFLPGFLPHFTGHLSVPVPGTLLHSSAPDLSSSVDLGDKLHCCQHDNRSHSHLGEEAGLGCTRAHPVSPALESSSLQLERL